MSTVATPITADQLLDMGDTPRCELVRGEVLPMAPAGAEHGDISMELGHLIKVHVKARKLGKVYAAETGFILARNPDTVRGADVAFVRKSRLPAGPVRGFFPGAPDLAVEVVSPGDRLSKVAAKVDEWLNAGAGSVWVVDPPNRTISVYRAGNEVRLYREADELRDEPTLPGFAVRVGAVFEDE